METELKLTQSQKKPRPYVQSSKWIHRKHHKPKLRVRVVTTVGRKQQTITTVNTENRSFITKSIFQQITDQHEPTEEKLAQSTMEDQLIPMWHMQWKDHNCWCRKRSDKRIYQMQGNPRLQRPDEKLHVPKTKTYPHIHTRHNTWVVATQRRSFRKRILSDEAICATRRIGSKRKDKRGSFQTQKNAAKQRKQWVKTHNKSTPTSKN